MARRIYIGERVADTTLDPSSSVPGLCRAFGHEFRGFGFYTAAGALAASPPAAPSAIHALPLAGDWYLVGVETTDWTWWDTQVSAGRALRLPDRDPSLGYNFTLNATQRNALRNFLSGKAIDFSFTNGETVAVIGRRLMERNPAFVMDLVTGIETLWNATVVV